MIKINLATRKGPGGRISSGSNPASVKGLTSLTLRNLEFIQLNQLPLRKIGVPIFIGFFASFMCDFYKENVMKKLEVILDKTNSEITQSRKEADKFKDYESIKKSLDGDETEIRIKLGTIQQLLTGRANSTNILVSLSNAIPQNAWMTEFKIDNGAVSLKGFALEFNQISDFMKSLSENAIFTEVDMKQTKQEKDDRSPLGMSVYFELTAKLR